MFWTPIAADRPMHQSYKLACLREDDVGKDCRQQARKRYWSENQSGDVQMSTVWKSLQHVSSRIGYNKKLSCRRGTARRAVSDKTVRNVAQRQTGYGHGLQSIHALGRVHSIVMGRVQRLREMRATRKTLRFIPRTLETAIKWNLTIYYIFKKYFIYCLSWSIRIPNGKFLSLCHVS